MSDSPKMDFDQEDDEVGSKVDLRRAFEFLIDTLLFYRNVILGAIVLGGISTWIYFLSINKDTNGEGGTLMTEAETPTLSIDVEAGSPMNDDSQAESGSASSNDSAEASNGFRDSSRLRTLLESGSKAELLDYSIEVKDSWQQKRPLEACVMLNGRLKVTRRLMEMELTSTERMFVLTSYIESVSVLDSLNTQGRLGLKGTREALIEVDKIYANHELTPVSAKANLAYVIVPAYELVVDTNVRKIAEVAERLDERGQFIFVDLKSTEQLCEVLLGIWEKRLFPEECKKLAVTVLNRIDDLGDSKFDALEERFSERIYFGHLEFDVLIGRIAIDDVDTRQKVQSLFDGLETAPNSRIGIYSTAATFIRVYIQTANFEAAEHYLGQFRRSAARISNKEKREEALKYARVLEKELLESQSADSGK